MQGQMNIFDFADTSGSCHSYKFKRYLGQPVGFWRTGHCGVIVKIEEYYTEVLTDEGIMVGTSYDLTDQVEIYEEDDLCHQKTTSEY